MGSLSSEDEVNGLLGAPIERPENAASTNHRAITATARKNMQSAFLMVVIVVTAVALFEQGDKALEQRNENSTISGGSPTQPEVAWLMSYPNSGTSYTLRVIHDASGFATATNYGKDRIDEETGMSTPLYDNDITQGPFLHHGKVPPAESYILTKTHCGGRCEFCPLTDAIETMDAFYHHCMSGTVVKNYTDVTHGVRLGYDQHVKRAIHLIRAPVDNAVARFHLYNKGLPVQDRYENDRAGFREFCKTRQELYQSSDLEMSQLSDEAKALFVGLPCYGEFVLYAQWHSLAIETIVRQKQHTLESSMVFHYENYGTNFDESLATLLDFLGLKQQANSSRITRFISGKSYHDYLTDDERRQAFRLLKAFASTEAWELMKRYAPEQ